MKKTNEKFITISLMCVFLLVMMISFAAVNVKGTFSATEVACYTCTDVSIGKYAWGDYSDNSACSKLTAYTTKDSCLANNCSNGQTLDSDGSCVNDNGLVTVLFKSGSLTVFRSTCNLLNGSCRIALREYQNAIGWSEEPDCSDIVETSSEFITFTKAKTYTYYACNAKNNGESSVGASSSSSSKKSSSKKSSSSKVNGTVDNNGNQIDDDNPETGGSWIVMIFLGGFLMALYTSYVYRNGIKIDETK